MNCGGCGRSNREVASFCSGCGARLVVRCSACGNELELDARFCDACGAPVAAGPTAPAVHSGAAGDRKVVTVLFADLAGSTSMQEQLDAESTARLMERVHQVLSAAVVDHGGRVVKSTGDGVMAVFGIPVLREDDARRAVEAALAMQASFTDLATEIARGHGVEVALRVGINTGEVVVAPDSDDVVGDPVNVAARLEAAAGVGEVFVGPETARLVRDDVQLEDREPLALKGKREPVTAARVVGLGHAMPVAQAFLGRDRDLAAILGELDAAVAQRHARLATVVGFPGLGKSRLAAEVAGQVSDRSTIVDVRFVADTTSTFAPIASALRAAVDVRDLDLGEDAERVAATIDALAAGSAAGSAEQIFWSVRRSLEAIAASRPAVVVLDDVQWAEPSMLDLVEHLTEWLTAPVLLLALARPELRDVRPSLLEPGGPSTSVFVLSGLDDEACRRLALDVLDADHLPDAVLDRVLDAGEGNPLFVRELLRLLVDDGVLQRAGETWTVTVEVDAVELPASVHATIAARIEQLAPDERAVLQAAAVVGRHFARGAVAALLPGRVADRLDLHLSSLHRRALVDPEGTWWDDERMFRFHHVLIRDAAYRRVLKEVRAELHVRYADWLTTRPGEHDEVLGDHLARSIGYRQELGTDVDPGLVDRAARHLATAGRRALDADDVANAAALLDRALELSPGDRSLLRDRAEALVASGDMHAAATAVAALAAAADDERSRATADVYEAQLAGQRTPEALRQVAERAGLAASVLAEHHDDVGVAKAEAVQATALAGLGQVGACEAALDRSLAAARRAGDARLANVVLSIAPAAALWGPSPVARASGRCLDVVRVLRITTWAPQVEARALQAQAVLEALRDRADAARRLLDSSRQTFTDLGHRHGLLETAMYGGLVEMLADRPAEAELLLRQAREGFEALGSRVAAARATALLARALLELDRLDEAEALADPLLGGDDLKASIGLLGVAAEVSARRGAIAGAEALARKAVALAEPTDALVDHADARLALARVLEAAEKPGEAAEQRRRARDLYEQKGATVGLDRVARASIGAAGERHSAPGEDADEQPVRLDPEAGQPPATLGGRRWRPNRASSAVLAWEQRSRAGSPVDDLYHPELMWDDHTIMGMAASKDQLVSESVDARSEHGYTGVAVEILATLGGRHALSRMTSRWVEPDGGDVEWTRLFVSRVQDDGRFVRFDTFWEDDLADAVNCLFERCAEEEPDVVPEGTPMSPLPPVHRLLADRDWEALQRCFSHDAVLVDHRPAAAGAVEGPAAVRDWFAAFVDRTDLTTTRVVDVLALDPWRALFVSEATGSVDGAPFVVPTLLLLERAPQGPFRRMELFPTDQRDEALSAFDRLGVEAPQRHVTENLATEVIGAWGEAMARADDDALSAMIGDSFLWSSEPLHMEATERPIDDVRVIPPGADIAMEIVASLGRRHCLYRLVASWDDEDAGRVDWTGGYVLRVTEDRRFARIDCFDHDQIAPAAACLVERWAEDELEPAAGRRARGMVRGLRIAEPYEARDWDAVRSVCADEIHFVDHRLPAAGELRGPDAVIAWLRPFVDPIEDLRAEVTDVHGLTPRAAIVTWRSSGVLHGAPLETDAFIVSRWDDNGALERMEMFALDRFDDAMDCFARFDSPPTERRRFLPNQASRTVEGEIIATLGDRHVMHRDGARYLVTVVDDQGTVVDREEFDRVPFSELVVRWAGAAGGDRSTAFVRFGDASEAADWETMGDSFTADAVLVDHRSAVECTGREEIVEFFRTFRLRAERAGSHCEDVLALTPDGALLEVVTAGEADEAPFEHGSFTVATVRDGRFDRAELFDRERLEDAWARYDELVGHQVARLGSQSLYRRSDGRFAVGRESLETDSLDRALEELVRRWAANDHPGDVIAEQRAEAMVRALQIELLLESRDWDRLREACDERVVLVDHVGMSGRVEGVEPIRRWAEPIPAAEAVSQGAAEVLAFEPNRLLVRSGSHGTVDGTAFDWESLVVMRFAPDGRLASIELFDPADQEGAWRSFDGPPLVRHHRVRPNLAWAAVQRRAPVDHVLTIGDRHTLWRDAGQLVLSRCDDEARIVDEIRCDSFFDARRAIYASARTHEGIDFRHQRLFGMSESIAADRWDDVRDRYDKNALLIDHRPLRMPGFLAGGDAIVAWMKEYRSDERHVEVVDLLAVSELVLLYQTRIWGSSAGGGFEAWPLMVVKLGGDGRVVEQHHFDGDQLDAAWHRYETLVTQPPDNDVVRVLRRYSTAVARRDLDDAVSANAPDVVNHDRRPLVGGEPKVGVDGARAETKAILDFGAAVLMTVEPIEIRGDRLALVRQAVGVDRVIEYLVVSACDAGGELLTHNLMFDESQFDEAMAELDSLEAQHRHDDREVARP